MESQFILNARRIEGILLRHELDTRTKILRAFDRRGRGSRGILGIGPILQKQLVLMLDAENYGPIEWQQLMPGIEWEPDPPKG